MHAPPMPVPGNTPTTHRAFLPRAEAVLAISTRIHVVGDHGRATERFLQGFFQLHIFPAQVRRFQDDAAVKVQWAGTADADRTDSPGFDARLVERLLDRFDDSMKNFLGAFTAFGFRTLGADDFKPGVEHRRHHLGPAKVKPQPVFFIRTHGNSL